MKKFNVVIAIVFLIEMLSAKENLLVDKYADKRRRSEATLSSKGTFDALWVASVTKSLVRIENPKHSAYQVTHIHSYAKRNNIAGKKEEWIYSTPATEKMEELPYRDPLEKALFSQETQEKAYDLFSEIRRFAKLVKRYAPKEKLVKGNLFLLDASGATGAEENYTYPIRVKYKVNRNPIKTLDKAFNAVKIEGLEDSFEFRVPLYFLPFDMSEQLVDDVRPSFVEILEAKSKLSAIASDPQKYEEVNALTAQISELEKKLVIPTMKAEFQFPLSEGFKLEITSMEEKIRGYQGYYRAWGEELLSMIQKNGDVFSVGNVSSYKKEKAARDGVSETFVASYLMTAKYIIHELMPVLIAHEKQIHKLYDTYSGLNGLLEDSKDLEAVKKDLGQDDSQHENEVTINAQEIEIAKKNLRAAFMGRLIDKMNKNEITSEDMQFAIASFEKDPLRFLKQ